MANVIFGVMGIAVFFWGLYEVIRAGVRDGILEAERKKKAKVSGNQFKQKFF